MRRENQRGIAAIDRLVLVETKHILNQRFVEVVFNLIDNQIKPIQERCGNKGVEKHALSRTAGKKVEQLLVGHDLISGLIAFELQTEVVLILHGDFMNVLIENP